MKLILFGHRGVGKSSLLKRLGSYVSSLSEDNCFCVDALIEERCGQSIKEFMEQKGEEAFRLLEKEVFLQKAQALSDNSTAVLALGAGYQGPFPKGWKVLWVQRAVDSKKFVSRSRPSLSSEGSLHLPEERFAQREKLYAAVADYELELLEHRDSHCSAEEKYFQFLFSEGELEFSSSAFVTLSSQRLETVERDWNWELRDDGLTIEEITQALERVQGRIIFSFRNKEKVEDHAKTFIGDSSFAEKVLWDWPLDWGECPFGEPSIFSLHERRQSLSETLQLFRGRKGLLKLAVPIDNFAELQQGYEWFLEDPSQRIFLPSSQKGRWQWFRQLLSSQMPFYFLREGKGSSPDQPSLLKTLKDNPQKRSWGAVLGKPISHSLTPWFQEECFGKAFPVELDVSEWDEALPFLTELGMTRAAVTSPLKQKAFSSIENKEDNLAYGAVNTLQFSDGKWWGTNTDRAGFQKLIEDWGQKKVAVWGGGGTLSAIKEEIPEASFYSSRKGSLKEGEGGSPEVVVWAVGRESFDKEGQMPPESWSPSHIVDLNYSEDSPGIVCAQAYGCQYQSGLSMFVAQAREQQRFWKEYERK